MFVELDYPVFCISQSIQKDAVLVAGGGGKSKTGIPNTVSIVKNNGKAREIVKKYDFDDAVSFIATDKVSQKFIAAAVGKDVKLYDPKFRQLSSYDTGSEQLLFRSISFSSDGKKLVVVDGENSLHLLTVPGLRQIGTYKNVLKVKKDENTEEEKPLTTRAAFLRIPKVILEKKNNEDENEENKEEEENKKAEEEENEGKKEEEVDDGFEDAVCVVNQLGIKILKAEFGLDEICKIENIDIEPRSIDCRGSTIIVPGIKTSQKQSVIAEYEYSDKKINEIRTVRPSDGIITAFGSGENTVAIATSEGEVDILNRKTLKTIRRQKNVHYAPITFLCESGKIYATGSLDRSSSAVPNTADHTKAFIITPFVILIIALLVFYILKMNKLI